MDINVNGVSVTLTEDQLKQIDLQVKRKSLKVTDRIKSYEDACADQNIDPIESKPFKNPSNVRQERSNANWELMIICDDLNEGVTMVKYWQPYFNFKNGKIVSFRFVIYGGWDDGCCYTSVGLSVHSQELGAYLGTQFLETFKRANNK